MVAPRKYPEELREGAIRLPLDAHRDPALRAGGVYTDRSTARNQLRDVARMG
jgi:hypothetical protein